jgi:rubrerythrin
MVTKQLNLYLETDIEHHHDKTERKTMDLVESGEENGHPTQRWVCTDCGAMITVTHTTAAQKTETED